MSTKLNNLNCVCVSHKIPETVLIKTLRSMWVSVRLQWGDNIVVDVFELLLYSKQRWRVNEFHAFGHSTKSWGRPGPGCVLL